ncbi:MAG: hypothetical protein ABIG30_03095 [Candidatus Aenigmatarchaeota archaeon]
MGLARDVFEPKLPYIGPVALRDRAMLDEEIEFYGEIVPLIFQIGEHNIYVMVREKGRDLLMPVMPGDVIGVQDWKGEFKYREVVRRDERCNESPINWDND